MVIMRVRGGKSMKIYKIYLNFKEVDRDYKKFIGIFLNFIDYYDLDSRKDTWNESDEYTKHYIVEGEFSEKEINEIKKYFYVEKVI